MARRRGPAARRRGGRRGARRVEGTWPAVVLVGAVAVSAVTAAVRWLATHWWVPVALLAVAGAVAAAVGRVRAVAARERRRRLAGLRMALSGPGGIDHMSPDGFEYAVRDLLARDGCRAEKVGRSNDQGVDVLADDPMGRRWAVQCKHKQDPVGGKPVGVGVLYALAGTFQRVHAAQVAVVVTNGRFSRDSVRWGAEQGVLLVDRAALARWASEGRPLWDVLPRVPAPRNGRLG
ncbi:restriction endonuclease [Kitasatospora sp. NPDC002965]|uniref:restriction endonuclease n=1 Tax=Kitasatospora sp. NPDC002965 TaxID=3154775 RepID=UPI0033BE0529